MFLFERAVWSKGTQRERPLLRRASLSLPAVTSDTLVVDIAREVGSSPATFYQYFGDVEAAVLALSAAVGEETVPLQEMIAAAGGARAKVHIHRWYDVTVNDPALTAWSIPTLARMAGEGRVTVSLRRSTIRIFCIPRKSCC